MDYTKADRNYVTAVAEYIDPPPVAQRPDPIPAPNVEAGLGAVLTIANVLVTIIIVIGMMVDGTQAASAIITGALYFAITSIAFAGLITGTATATFATWQHQRTERRRLDIYADLAEMSLAWRIEVELRQLPPPAAAPPQTPSATDNFVAPYRDADAARAEALTWLASLYGRDGLPNPRKIITEGDSRGRLRVRMLGSKRGTGTREAGLWLLQAGMVRRVEGGYAVDLSRCPTVGSIAPLR